MVRELFLREFRELPRSDGKTMVLIALMHTWGEGTDAHGLKIQGRGYLMFFAKIPRGVKGFRKNCLGRGGSPYFGFYCIFINKCFEICLTGVLYLPSPLPHLTPPGVHLWVRGYAKEPPKKNSKKLVTKIR